MGVEDYSEKDLLKSAMDLIQLQNEELERLRHSLTNVRQLSESQVAEAGEAQRRARTMEELLEESEEGIAEALTILGEMKKNLAEIDKAASLAISKFTDIGFTGTVSGDMKALANAIDSAQDKDLTERYEKYLTELHAKINRSRR